MSKPIAVLISDIHYSLQTLELADKSLRMAIDKANELHIPLIVAGDLHDTKANLRGECVNAMIETFKTAKNRPWVLVGNHDKINEKSIYHSLNFLSPYAEVINDTTHCIATDTPVVLIPYQFAASGFSWELARLKERKIIIAHQGIQGSDGGHYIQDLSAIRKEEAGTFRIISGHYHKRQDIELPHGGIWSYIGSPYTLTFGEANDPEKGFQILNEDGSLTFVPTNLRKHIIWELKDNGEQGLLVRSNVYKEPNSDDLLWIKAIGPKQKLDAISKQLLKNTWSIKPGL
jgi:DNA repair exonuclease SbcCD nuclease subunit